MDIAMRLVSYHRQLIDWFPIQLAIHKYAVITSEGAAAKGNNRVGNGGFWPVLLTKLHAKIQINLQDIFLIASDKLTFLLPTNKRYAAEFR